MKRVLPPTPGQSTNGKPPSKPPRQQSSQIIKANVPDGGRETSYSYCGSVDLEQSAIDEGLRSRLKRIAKEIASRASGYQDRKPPPVCSSILAPSPLKIAMATIHSLLPFLLFLSFAPPAPSLPPSSPLYPSPLLPSLLPSQPYEQAGNSIGYQLLHQNHSDVTTKLIDFLYPVLKVNSVFASSILQCSLYTYM